MSKIIYVIAILLAIMIGLASACKPNNDFFPTDSIDVCTGVCTYQNESNMSQNLICDSSVSCVLTTYYPNNTLITNSVIMTLNATSGIFNYTIPNINNTLGNYSGQFNCNRNKGWDTQNFLFSIANAPDTTPPAVSIISPTSGQDFRGLTNSITITANVSVSDSFLSSCWYDFGTFNPLLNPIACVNGYNTLSFTIITAGSYTLNFYAEDSAGNTNSTNVSFTVSLASSQVPYSSGGGIVYTFGAIDNKLSSINITAPESAKFLVPFELYIKALNLNGSYSEVDNVAINISSIPADNYRLMRTDMGEYTLLIDAFPADISSIDGLVTLTQGSKNVTGSFSVPISKQTLFDRKDGILYGFSDWVQKNWLYITLVGIALFLIFLVIVITNIYYGKVLKQSPNSY